MHRYRVDVNADQLPVNRPRCPVHTCNADDEMRVAGNSNPDAYYEPNSFNGPMQDERFREPPPKISGDADRYNHRHGNDDYRQPGDLFRLMSPEQKDQLFHNIKAAMDGVPVGIVKRQIVHFYRVDPDYGIGVVSPWPTCHRCPRPPRNSRTLTHRCSAAAIGTCACDTVCGCRQAAARSYCAASLAIARSLAAVSSLSEAGGGMAMTL